MTEDSERATQRYEYTVVGAARMKDMLEKRLNALAADGWQLVEQGIKDDATSHFFDRSTDRFERFTGYGGGP
jgi:predicted transcriptional regulator